MLNRLSSATLQQKTPLEVATSQQPDISAIIAFHWYQPVYFRSTKPTYPPQTQERSGRIVGIAEHQGDALTFLIMDDITHRVIPRSELRPRDPLLPNLPMLRELYAKSKKRMLRMKARSNSCGNW
jgi:hypothetical protein